MGAQRSGLLVTDCTPPPNITTRLPCPKCTGYLAVKQQRYGNRKRFLGCTSFPECTYTEPLKVDQQLRMQGAPTLPGFP